MDFSHLSSLHCKWSVQITGLYYLWKEAAVNTERKKLSQTFLLIGLKVIHAAGLMQLKCMFSVHILQFKESELLRTLSTVMRKNGIRQEV